MAKKITETTERWCCEPSDLTRLPTLRKCQHCGQIHKDVRVTDPAGAADTVLEAVDDEELAKLLGREQ